MKLFVFIFFIFIYSCGGMVKTQKHEKDLSKVDIKIKNLENENYTLKLKLESLVNRMILLETQVIKLKNNSLKRTKETSNEIRNIKDIISPKELERIRKMDSADENEEPVILTNSMLGKKIKISHKTKKVKKIFKSSIKTEYKKALDLYRSNQFFESIESFKTLIKKYKKIKTSLSDNFYYWIGENYLSLDDIPLAREYFNRVITKYPSANKVPDSIYKLGLILEKENKNKEAILKYKKVINTYSDTEAAKLSKERLDKLEGE